MALEKPTLKRRLITIPAFLLGALLVTVLFPVLLVLALVASLWKPAHGAVPTLFFITGYLWFEAAGIIAAPIIWLRSRTPQDAMRANFAMQCWWASGLMRMAQRFFSLRLTLHNEAALTGGPALVLPRHASIADTVLPVTYFARPFNTHLRYIMKRELLVDPCLDIYGNRLPNYFVDRSGQDTDAAVDGIRQLTETLDASEGMLLYPEGTRYSPAKHEALRRKGNQNPKLVQQLNRWPDLLPPRLGGTLAMLESNPGRDLLFMAHVGFEGSSHFKNLINGSWRRAQVHLAFWRVPFAQIPTQREELMEFLFEQWDRMQSTVARLNRLASQGTRS
ncbi:MAG: 1-acyl-sn-glycerol-3-phosphate acyltransferase [Pseudomonadota bacterium]